MLWISERSQYKIFLAIKQRYKKYGIVWFSRMEYIRFWVSERKLKALIKQFGKQKFFIKVWMAKCSSNPFKCNIFKLSKEFVEFLEKVREFTKPSFTYVKYTPDDVIAYVSSFAKRAYNQWKFCIDWTYYIVADRGKWRWKIYDTANNKIVSLITIKWIK